MNNSPQTYTGSRPGGDGRDHASSVPGAVTNILTGGAATQTTAGTYAVTADFVPTDTTNYNTLIGLSAGNFVIEKASQVINVTQSAPATAVYNTTFNVAASGGGSGLPASHHHCGRLLRQRQWLGYGHDDERHGNLARFISTRRVTRIINNAAAQVTQTTTAQKATATVTLNGLATYVYDGSQKVVTATTNPAGLTVNITYNGGATAPTNVGTYTVVGTISEANYQGTATATNGLIISAWTAKGFYQPVDMTTTNAIVWQYCERWFNGPVEV